MFPKGTADPVAATDLERTSRNGLTATLEHRHTLIGMAIAQHADGMSLREIATQIGISHTAVRKWLLGEVPAEYRQAQQVGLIQRIVECDEALDSATDKVSVARESAACRYARWDAERRLPALFGATIDVSITQHIDLKGAIEDAKRRVVTIENPPQESIATSTESKP